MLRAPAALAALLFWILPIPQQESQPTAAGKIESVRAPAAVIRDSKVTDLKVGDILQINDVVQTGKGGRLRITLKDGSTLSLGQRAELRVVTHDPARQLTLIEMLHGHVRAHVTSITKPGGAFEVRTPTARIRAVGTVVSASAPVVDSARSQLDSVISQERLNDLPVNSRNFQSLAQLIPGVASGTADRVSLGDYDGVLSTGVTAEDHFASVTNFDVRVGGQTDLLPGEFTIVPRGQPPQSATPMYLSGGEYSPEFKEFGLKFGRDYSSGSTLTPRPNTDSSCRGGTVINGVYVPPLRLEDSGKPVVVPQYRIEVTGTTGISTGNSLQIHFFNDSQCSLKFVVTNGAILRPTGFTGRVIEGLLLGTAPLKDYQKMYTLGGKLFLKPALAVSGNPAPRPAGANAFVAGSATAPAGSEATMMLRSYCVELHKLAPHPKTVYKFADAGDQKKYAPNRELVDRAFHLVLTRQITLPPGQTMDSLVQWMLWKNIEGLDEKRFHEEFFDLVKKNYEAQKKWDKNAQQDVEKLEQDLWNNTQKVLTAKN